MGLRWQPSSVPASMYQEIADELARVAAEVGQLVPQRAAGEVLEVVQHLLALGRFQKAGCGFDRPMDRRLPGPIGTRTRANTPACSLAEIVAAPAIVTTSPATTAPHRFAMTSPPRLGRRESTVKTWMAPIAA